MAARWLPERRFRRKCRQPSAKSVTPGGGAPWPACWRRYPPLTREQAREPPLAASRCRAAERVDALLTRPGLRIERIVSWGQASPPGFWYDQAEAEWVLVLAGAARLRFEDETEARLSVPAIGVDIAPHRRHRVDWTDPAAPTVWLAVFYR